MDNKQVRCYEVDLKYNRAKEDKVASSQSVAPGVILTQQIPRQ